MSALSVERCTQTIGSGPFGAITSTEAATTRLRCLRLGGPHPKPLTLMDAAPAATKPRRRSPKQFNAHSAAKTSSFDRRKIKVAMRGKCYTRRRTRRVSGTRTNGSHLSRSTAVDVKATLPRSRPQTRRPSSRNKPMTGGLIASITLCGESSVSLSSLGRRRKSDGT